MHVLVTGGTGYIGSHTIVELLLEGHEVTVVDTLANSKASVLGRLEEIVGKRPEFHQVDVRDAAGLDAVFDLRRVDAVVHFAGLKAVGESTEQPLQYYDVNVGGSVTLFRAMMRHDVSTVVFSSSATVYGDPESVPVTESAPTMPPTNPYGRSKLMVENILGDVAVARPDWRIAILRYFNPVGAHESGLIGEDPNDIPNNLMPYIAQVAAEQLPELQVFGGDYPTRDGTGIRDYIHVDDLARGHVAALGRLAEGPGLHVWNLGTGRGTTVLEMVAAFEAASGVPIPRTIVGRRPGDVAENWADPAKARAELGWETRHDIARMCADTWRWQRHALTLDDESSDDA